LPDTTSNGLRIHAWNQAQEMSLEHEGKLIPRGETPGARAFETGVPVVTKNVAELQAYRSPFLEGVIKLGVRSSAAVPLTLRGKTPGARTAAAYREDAFRPKEVELLVQVANQVAPIVANALAYREIEKLNQKLSQEKLYLEGEIQNDFQEIVGQSASVKKVL